MNRLAAITESFKYEGRIVVSMWSEGEEQELEDLYATTPNKVIADKIGRTESSVKSKAHLMGLEKDRRKSRVYETRQSGADYPTENDAFANYICGFVDGEGSFIKRVNGDNHSFTFCIEVVESDVDILEEIQGYLGVGNVYISDAQKDGWQRTAQYQVNDADALARTIIPFFKHYGLRAKLKREQFNEFETEFHDYFGLEPKPLYGNSGKQQSR